MNTHVVARILIKVWCTSLRLTMYSFGFYSILILCDFFFMKALMAMPTPDFSLCLFLIPERVVIFFILYFIMCVAFELIHCHTIQRDLSYFNHGYSAHYLYSRIFFVMKLECQPFWIREN